MSHIQGLGHEHLPICFAFSSIYLCNLFLRFLPSFELFLLFHFCLYFWLLFLFLGFCLVIPLEFTVYTFHLLQFTLNYYVFYMVQKPYSSIHTLHTSTFVLQPPYISLLDVLNPMIHTLKNEKKISLSTFTISGAFHSFVRYVFLSGIILSFCLKVFLFHFLQWQSAGNKISQTL